MSLMQQNLTKEEIAMVAEDIAYFVLDEKLRA